MTDAAETPLLSVHRICKSFPGVRALHEVDLTLNRGEVLAVIGENADLTYDYHYAGAGPQSLAALADHPPAQAERPMFIVGQGALNRPDGGAILSMAARAALS